MDNNKLRNFCIIAHIDHGKSTLADRILEFTGAISSRDMKEQFLDKMELERERGITIKAKAVRLNYHSKDGQDYIFNLIDTPGHVDFTYEVSKSLFACEGALLIVDASQGVEAQTIANFHLAKDAGLRVIPVINKIDLQGAEPEKVLLQLEELGLNSDEAILASAKEGIGTEQILEAIVKLVPPPRGHTEKPLKALIFDSLYDVYKGVVVFFRIFDGSINAGVKVLMMRANSTFEVTEVGVFTPTMKQIDKLSTGEVGYFIANIKNVSDIKVGDTITDVLNPIKSPLPGYKEIKPMVFCGFYPINPNEYNLLKDALEKLKLNDSSLAFEPESSRALGFGFRCGFLGLLHMEIVQERLERENNIEVVQTAPTVTYEVVETSGEVYKIESPSQLPERTLIQELREPYVKLEIITPKDSIGGIMKLAESKRCTLTKTDYISPTRVMM